MTKRDKADCGIPYLIHKIQIHVYIQYTGYCDVLNQTMHLIQHGYMVMTLKDVNLSYINKKGWNSSKDFENDLQL